MARRNFREIGMDTTVDCKLKIDKGELVSALGKNKEGEKKNGRKCIQSDWD